ncbi:MAG: sigma factor-like helix-turn-helix DNA-binding protein [Bacteroidota bacterium]
MRQNTGVLGLHPLGSRLLIAIICFFVILYFYRSISMASNAKELTTMLALTQDSVVKGSNHRIFLNLILCLQAGIGLSFIIVPFVIAIYHNRALLQRLNKRVATYEKRKKEQAMKYEVELREDTISEEFFFKRLLQIHPNLTPHDLTLCTLLRQNYSSKEIAEELNITSGSVNTARYRLRKKLVMERETDLIMYLRKIA